MMRSTKIVLLLLLLCLGACKRFPNPFGGSEVLAKVGGQTLYLYDVASIFTPGMNAEDSLKLLDSYVDMWVRKQLKVQEAERHFESSEEDIDRMVAEYRTSLMTYKLDQYYIDSRIDTVFTDAQIRAYYQDNLSDFVLDKPLVKARVVKLPDNYRQTKQLLELMRSPSAEDMQDFTDLCIKNNLAMTEINNWSDFQDLLSVIPTDKEKSYDYMLAGDKIYEFTNGRDKFYVKIIASRKVGDQAPEESMREVIRRVIFNNRKKEIVRNYEDSLYRVALQEKELEVRVAHPSAQSEAEKTEKQQPEKNNTK